MVGDSITPTGSPQVDLRIRFKNLIMSWWPHYSIPAKQMTALVEGTGWQLKSTCKTAKITLSCCVGRNRSLEGSSRG